MSQLFNSIKDWREFRQAKLLANKKIGFVPTMGNLHAGHQSLLHRSVQENDYTVLSIFVNPTQFDNPEDLKKYPRTLEQDIELAKASGVDFIFIPEYEALYPDNYRYRVQESELSQQLCGKHRPGHFDGMLTVVLKLLQLVKADKAYFGEKDFQQLQLITGMAEAFFLDTKIIPCPIIRDDNTLALSSRNSRLLPEQYQMALHFPKLLQTNLTKQAIISALTELGFEVDYIEEHNGRRFGAVKIGQVRLIDNTAINGEA